MKSLRLAALAIATTLILTAVWAPSASASFGFEQWDGAITADQTGAPYTQAGGHPYEIETTIDFNTHTQLDGLGASEVYPDANTKDVLVDVPPGLIGNPTVLPRCTAQQLSEPHIACPIASQVGKIYVILGGISNPGALPVPLTETLYNMVPPAGVPARFGFRVVNIGIVLDGAVRGEASRFHLGVDSRGISQTLPVIGARVVFWGVPADPAHDDERCAIDPVSGACEGASTHSAGVPPVPFLTMPTSCTAPGEGLRFEAAIDSWLEPGLLNPDGSPDPTDPAWQSASFFTHEPVPNEATQRGTEGCDRVPSEPAITVQPTVQSAESPTGLNVDLKVPSEGLLNPTGVAQSTLKKVSVTLPQGMTINPSAGEGLGSCAPAQYASETKTSEPGEGCPSDSKIGSVEVDTPLLETPIPGNLYIAKQGDNPFGSLLALYIVAKDPTTGVLVKAAGRVEPDPQTGQLTTTFENLPQAPFSDFKLSFREGQRSPLSTPPACGRYTTQARFTPWSDPSAVVTSESSFEVTQGVGGGPCPASDGARPFHPQVSAGTLNNNAGSYSPFYLRMSRRDGEQEITSFSSHLPPGLSGRLAGVPECSEAQIALARSRQHEGGGAQELANPSCPAASEIGRTLVGAGVGSTLAYAPGKVYLAGPYHGSPLSIAAITTATVGPFDLGTVVVRSALRIDPETARVSVDAAGTDPIPHIIDGIPVHVRDIRVYVDRPDFTLNPTSCDPFAVASTLTGSGADFASAADDVPATVSDPFQAANCASLAFKPHLALSLKGPTHRTGNPALRAVLTYPKQGAYANIAAARVTLPPSEFLDNAHIQTVCTRVQFNEAPGNGAHCPPASIYGHATAITPLLEAPLSGPVYLRSSDHKLPDLVAALNGQIDVTLDGRVDTGRGGGLRNTFEAVPDAPVSKFVLSMQGGKQGLLVNSADLCGKPQHASVDFTAQNGKLSDTRPLVANSCPKGHRSTNKSRHRRG